MAAELHRVDGDHLVVGEDEHDHLEEVPGRVGAITSTFGGSASESRSNDTISCSTACRTSSSLTPCLPADR